MTAHNHDHDELLDLVLGAVDEGRRAALEAQVQSCAECAAIVAALRERQDELDRTLAALVDVEPSPEFRARVLQAAAEAPSGWFVQMRWWVAVPATVVLLVAAVAVYRFTRPDPLLEFGREAAAWRSPTESLLILPGDDVRSAALTVGETYFDYDPSALNGTATEEEN